MCLRPSFRLTTITTATTPLRLPQRLAEVEAALGVEAAARARLEEGAKRAFSRGVCALNIEAMALMRGQGQGELQRQGQPQGQGQPGEQQASPAPGGSTGADAGGPGSASQPLAQQKLGSSSGLGHVAAGWSIGAGMSPPAQSAATLPQPLPHREKPSAEVPRTLVRLAPTRPVAPIVSPPAGHRTAERHMQDGYSWPQTARPVPGCSLPTNLPPGIATVGRVAPSPSRPATAPMRRQQAAATASVSAGCPRNGYLQQVSRRSMAGQQRGAAAVGKAPIVRGAVAGQGKTGWQS